MDAPLRCYRVRIEATIADDVEVEAEDEEKAERLALDAWRYTEFVDIWADSIIELEEATSE